jgi:hypothetical protein
LSFIITILDKIIPANWFTFLLSLAISIFASSLLILANSLVSYPLLRKSSARDAGRLAIDIVETFATLELCVYEVIENPSLSKDITQLQVFDSIFVSMIRKLKEFVGKEQISWPIPTILRKCFIRNDETLSSIEARMVLYSFEALGYCSNCHINLVELRLYVVDKQAKTIQSFVQNWKGLYDYFSKTGKFNTLYERYVHMLSSI